MKVQFKRSTTKIRDNTVPRFDSHILYINIRLQELVLFIFINEHNSLLAQVLIEYSFEKRPSYLYVDGIVEQLREILVARYIR